MSVLRCIHGYAMESESGQCPYCYARAPDQVVVLCAIKGCKNQIAIPCGYFDTTGPYRCADHALEEAEAVNHPSHYGGADNPYETIKVLEAWLSPAQIEGFCLGNAIKYLSRAGEKGDALEDLQKARWYVDRLIQRKDK